MQDTQAKKHLLDPKTLFALFGYMGCSSLMLICNKLAVHYLPAPSLVLFGQLFCSAFAVKAAGMAGVIEVDDLEWNKVKSFSLVACAFLAAIFTNMKTLQYANVETFIVFRASTPLIISVLDYLFLGRELPSTKSSLCLVTILCGAFFYMYTDAGFEVTGYMWVCIWYCIFCFDQVYIKYAVDTVKMKTNWGRVYYTNLIACFPLIVIFLVTREDQTVMDFTWTPAAMIALSVSCALGVAMSYFAFLARSLVSATYFSVIGNCCKIITIFINYFMWDHHANMYGLIALSVCLGAAYYYEQAPKRAVVDRTKAGIV